MSRQAKPKHQKSDLLMVVEAGINREVGGRIRDARQMFSWRPEELGKQIGLAGSSVLALENGASPVKACQVILISQVLDVPLSFFLEGVGKAVIDSPARWESTKSDGVAMIAASEAASALGRIKHEPIRRLFRSLILEVANRLEAMDSELSVLQKKAGKAA